MYSTVQTLVATNSGPPIVCIPFALAHMGLIFCTTSVLIMAMLSHLSMMMYAKARDLLPIKLEDTWEVIYMLTGRRSIYLMCAAFYAHAWCMSVVCYIFVFESVALVIYRIVDLRETGQENAPAWMQWICIRSNLLILQSVLQVRKVPSRERNSFWGGLIIFRLVIFIIVIYIELLFTSNRLYDEPIDWNEMMKVKMDGMLIFASVMIVLSFSNQYMAIPAYN